MSRATRVPSEAAVNSQPDAVRSVLNRVANETRNTIHAVLGLVSVVEEGRLTFEQRAHLARCRNAAARLTRLVADAGECVEPTEPPLEPIREFAPAEVMEGLANVYGTVARDKGLQMHCVVDPSVPLRCCGWPRTIEVVLGHLLDNAIQFTAAGQVELRVHCVDHRLLRFTVSDSGCGVPMSVLNRLNGRRDPINVFRADRWVAGFGLALVQRRLAALGGTMHVTNRESGGCEVVIEVGIQPVESTQPSTANRASKIDRTRLLRPLKILVAEDADDSYALMEIYLQGHTLARAWNGPEAVRLAGAGTFDLILMDVHLPLLDGYAAASEIRMAETLHGRDHVPIVVLSADPFPIQVHRGALAGCSGFLEKPVSRDVLLSTVAAFVTDRV